MSWQRKQPKKILLQIKEGDNGLETFISDELHRVNDAYKGQFVTFLEGAVKELKDKKK